jgi:hypothetical protein
MKILNLALDALNTLMHGCQQLCVLLLYQAASSINLLNISPFLSLSSKVMSTEVSKVSHTTEEVIALKKYIQRANQDQEKLKEIIQKNKDRDEFLMNHR